MSLILGILIYKVKRLDLIILNCLVFFFNFLWHWWYLPYNFIKDSKSKTNLNMKTACLALETYHFINNLKFWTFRRPGGLESCHRLYSSLTVHPQQVTSSLWVSCFISKMWVENTNARHFSMTPMKISWDNVLKLLKNCKAIGKWKLSKKCLGYIGTAEARLKMAFRYRESYMAKG